MADNKNPASLFYWNDWENDPELRACSLTAQGLWMRMLCIAARSREPGFVLIGDASGTPEALAPLLARMTGETPKKVLGLIRELLSMGAAGLDSRGYVFCRRMVRAAALSDKRSDAAHESWKRRRERDAPVLHMQNGSNADASSILQDSNASVVDVSTAATVAGRAMAAMRAVWPDLDSCLELPGLSGSLGMVMAWMRDGADLERDILPTITRICQGRQAQGPPRNFKYFAQAVADAKATNESPLPYGQPDPARPSRQPAFRNGFAAMAHARIHGADSERGRMGVDIPDPDQPASPGTGRSVVPRQ